LSGKVGAGENVVLFGDFAIFGCFAVVICGDFVVEMRGKGGQPDVTF
jgi:hypothetical protein